MEDFNALQDELLKAFVEEGSISRRTFEEYSESLTGAMAKGFTDEVYAGRWTDLWKGPEGVRKWFTPDSQKGVSAIFNALKDKTGKTDDAQLMYAIDEYLDDKRENKTLTMTPELAKDYARRGWLKQNGYGSNFKPGDTLNVKGMGPRKITSIDDMGRPNFEITPEEAAKINQIKMRKSNAGN
jgi:hypothetical protein